MVCIYCGNDTQVTNSRLQKRANQVWRRRSCTVCGNTFTTHEAADLAASIVVQYSPRDLRPFSRDILFISIYESCKHRPAAVQDADELTQTVLSLLRTHINNGTLLREQIVLVTSETLARFDKTAATIYSAFHKAA